MIVRLGLSLMLEDAFRAAALPCFRDGLVDVLEWSFDTVWDELPEWAVSLLAFYGDRHALLGHGVSYSLLTAGVDPRGTEWLGRLTEEVGRRRYQRISEHFGFMRATGFARCAPLSLPRTEASFAVGRKRLQRLADVARVPVGLENLGFAWSRDDALGQGAFLEELLASVDGFLVLDLHNLWCQMCNFGLTAEELLATLPLHRMQGIHVSGGSWAEAAGRRIRRDTHDDAVPEAVLTVLKTALRRRPGPCDVIVERLGSTISDTTCLRVDLDRVRSVIEACDG